LCQITKLLQLNKNEFSFLEIYVQNMKQRMSYVQPFFSFKTLMCDLNEIYLYTETCSGGFQIGSD